MIAVAAPTFENHPDMTKPKPKAKAAASQPIAYSYLRFSSQQQAKGASRKRQSEQAVAWAAQRAIELDATLRDEGVSAFRGRHRDPTSALGAFLARVEAGEIAVGSFLLVESLDRLSREQVFVALRHFLDILGAGIVIVTLMDGYEYKGDTLDVAPLMMSIVSMSRAHEESALKSRRVGDAWARKRIKAVEDRQAMTARCPGWIRLVGNPKTGHYELIPERAAIVREIFAASIAGDGRRTIVKRLNERGQERWGVGASKATDWHDSYVAKILGSKAVFGVYEKTGEEITDYFPAVVDQQTFWRAKAATSSRSGGTGKIARNFANLLSGLARCSGCGGSMVYIDKGKRSRPVLKCSRAHRAGGCDMRQTFAYAGLESIVVFGFAHFEDAAMFALAEDVKVAQIELDAEEKRRAMLEVRLLRLADAIEGGMDLSVMKVRHDELRLELAASDERLAMLRVASLGGGEFEDDIEFRVDIIREKIGSADPVARYQGRSEVNARLRRYLDRVVVEPNGSVTYHIKAGFENIDTRVVGLLRPPREAQN